MKNEEKFPGLRAYKGNYIIQRLGAVKDMAGAIDLEHNIDQMNIKLLKSLQKELIEIHRFTKNNL